jgi:uncharacterized cupin superfamily protein
MGMSPNWFIVNIADAHALETETLGKGALFEDPFGSFPEFGINVRVMPPGKPASRYHVENAQEAFLVLDGSAVALVDGEEREMVKGDFLHLPPGVPHAIVAGPEGATVLMAGTRKGEDHTFEFPEHELADKHGLPREQPQPSPTKLGTVPW